MQPAPLRRDSSWLPGGGVICAWVIAVWGGRHFSPNTAWTLGDQAVSVHTKLPPLGSGEWELPSYSPLPMSVSCDLARPAVNVGVRPETLHSSSAPGKTDEAHPAGLHAPLAALWSCLPKT